MPVFYLDASAIAKMYLPDEQGVDFVVQLLGSRLSGDVFVTSTLSIVEVKSAISRRIDSPGDKESLLEAYDRDVQEIFNLVTVSDEIIQGPAWLPNNIDYAPEMQFIWQRHWTLRLPFRGFSWFPPIPNCSKRPRRPVSARLTDRWTMR